MEKNNLENNDAKEEIKKEKREDVYTSRRKTAVIIGGSSGIGCALAGLLASEGYRVISIARTECASKRIRSIEADITQGSELENAIAEAGQENGKIDLLIYSAGFSMAAPIEYAKESDYRYLFEVNYFGAIRAIRTSLPYMKTGGGKIFLISSLGGSLPIPFDSFYSSSKAALDLLAREARTELKPYHITVSTVLPGGTATSFTFKRKVYSASENGSYAKEVNKAVASLANKEQGGMSPQEVANCILKEIRKKDPAITIVCGGMNRTYQLMEKYLPQKWIAFLNDKSYNQ